MRIDLPLPSILFPALCTVPCVWAHCPGIDPSLGRAGLTPAVWGASVEAGEDKKSSPTWDSNPEPFDHPVISLYQCFRYTENGVRVKCTNQLC